MTSWDARDYFFRLHDVEVNQKYNKTLPYSFHLQMVACQAEKFARLIPEGQTNIAWIGIYGHDSIEDARMTFSSLEKLFGPQAAEVIFLCTEDRGRNRAERKSDGWYAALSMNPTAVFVKLCDLIANVKFSLLTNSSMLETYKKEYFQKVRPFLYCDQYAEMFDYLDKLFAL